MNRGATPYGLRGTPLVLPNGTLDNPSIRLGRERSGLYRSGDGKVSLSLKKARSAEFSGDGVAVFSNAASVANPGDGHVRPLSIYRVNATTADNQETAVDFYDGGLPVAKQSIFREASGKYGFKWYGKVGGTLHATPAMALSGDKDLAIGRDLGVTRNLLVSGNTLSLRPTTGAAGFIMSPVTSNQHSQITLSVNNTWNLYIALQATTSGFLSNNVADANIYTPAGSGGRLLLGAYGYSRIIMDTGQTRFFGDGLDLAAMITTGANQGRWRLARENVTPYTKLHIETHFNGDGITIGNSGGFGQGISINNNVGGPAVPASSILFLFSNQSAPGWQGGAMESGLYTSGTATGALLLGGQDVIKLKLNTDSIRFTQGPTEYAQMNNGGYWGLRTTSPQRTFHVVPAYPGDGIVIAGGSGQDPMLQLSNNPYLPSANARAHFGLANANGQFIGGSLASDAVIFTGGSGPGRLLLGTADAVRMFIDYGGNVTFHTAIYPGVRLAIKSTNTASAGGTRLYHHNDDGSWYANWIDDNPYLHIDSSAGYGVVLQRFGHFHPNTDGGAWLGGPSNHWAYFFINHIGIQTGASIPNTRLLQLGQDSALKPNTATWEFTSDARSKDQKSIRAFGDGLATIQRLRPIRYRYNGDFVTPKGEEGVGFVAEELAEVAPDMIRRATMKRRPEDDEAVEMLTISLHPLFFLLVNAVKELAERIDQLEGSAA